MNSGSSEQKLNGKLSKMAQYRTGVFANTSWVFLRGGRNVSGGSNTGGIIQPSRPPCDNNSYYINVSSSNASKKRAFATLYITSHPHMQASEAERMTPSEAKMVRQDMDNPVDIWRIIQCNFGQDPAKIGEVIIQGFNEATSRLNYLDLSYLAELNFKTLKLYKVDMHFLGLPRLPYLANLHISTYGEVDIGRFNAICLDIVNIFPSCQKLIWSTSEANARKIRKAYPQWVDISEAKSAHIDLAINLNKVRLITVVDHGQLKSVEVALDN